jgi:hypothetical protein
MIRVLNLWLQQNRMLLILFLANNILSKQKFHMFFTKYKLKYLIRAVFFVEISFVFDIELHRGVHLFILFSRIHCVLTNEDIQTLLFLEVLPDLKVSLLYCKLSWQRPFLHLRRRFVFLFWWGLSCALDCLLKAPVACCPMAVASWRSLGILCFFYNI